MRQQDRCRAWYGAERRKAKAPVMIAIREWPGINCWYVEAKDGSFDTRINGVDCAWCAKAEAVSEWCEKQEAK